MTVPTGVSTNWAYENVLGLLADSTYYDIYAKMFD